MTDNITMSRSVVERALKDLQSCSSVTHWPALAPTVDALRAALEQPPVEQEPAIYPEEAFDMGLEAIPYYTHPQNLRCKSTQARLATLWGYERPQPKREPLTDAQINDRRLALAYDSEDLPDPWDFKQGVRAAERAHGIGGEA